MFSFRWAIVAGLKSIELLVTVFVINSRFKVSKEELQKLIKEKIVNLVYDLLIMVDKLLAEVQDLKEEVKTPF